MQNTLGVALREAWWKQLGGVNTENAAELGKYLSMHLSVQYACVHKQTTVMLTHVLTPVHRRKPTICDVLHAGIFSAVFRS